MTAKPRRWWHFSLWQLFAIITVLCVYLAWQVSVVRGRKELLKEFQTQHPHGNVTTADQYSQYPPLGGPNGQPPTYLRPAVATVPIVRRWLGDEAIQSIGYDSGVVPDELVARLKHQFPEAKVRGEQILYPPCHPGCFPHGTLVATPAGPRKIEEIAVGDEVYRVAETGEKIPVPVLSIFRTENRLWEVATSRGVLLTTETQPLCNSLRDSVVAGELQAGDKILAWEGDQVQIVSIISIQQTDQVVPVVNLVLGNREPFIAGSFLARSKPPADGNLEAIADAKLQIAD